jgi:hypothetical protein
MTPVVAVVAVAARGETAGPVTPSRAAAAVELYFPAARTSLAVLEASYAAAAVVVRITTGTMQLAQAVEEEVAAATKHFFLLTTAPVVRMVAAVVAAPAMVLIRAAAARAVPSEAGAALPVIAALVVPAVLTEATADLAAAAVKVLAAQVMGALLEGMVPPVLAAGHWAAQSSMIAVPSSSATAPFQEIPCSEARGAIPAPIMAPTRAEGYFRAMDP